MLLRRVLQHVRNQEWTAIATDLVIVVVGVYMGIQAQAWNTARENRGVERQYLSSLHEAYVDNIVVGQQDLRISLHAALDNELGIGHGNEDPESARETWPDPG